jgi:formylglycine-generating enzyme required for sulfatase activity/regulator of sirC expression with transglutaminase-like and TPR domain
MIDRNNEQENTMKRQIFFRIVKITIFLISFNLITTANALASIDSVNIKESLEIISSATENEIDLQGTLLLISKHWDKTTNLDFLDQKLEKLTTAVKEKINNDSTTTDKVEILRNVIHKQFGFQYTDAVDPSGIPIDSSELFLHGLLKNRRGYCMNLSLLYLIVGERLGLPIYGVALPNHFFVRYETENQKFNIESTQNGISLPDKYYYDRFSVEDNPPDKFFMKNLSKKETLGSYFSNVGMAYYKHSQPTRAIFYLNLSTKINPLSIEAHNNLGNIYSEQKQPENAISQYLKAIEADPKNMAGLFNLGIAYMESGKSQQAVDAFQKALGVNPDYVPAHQILSRHFMKQKNFEEALPHLNKLFSLQPGNLKIQEALAEAHYRLDKFDQAIGHYKEILRKRPGMIKAYVQLGWTYYRKGQFQDSIKWTLQGLQSKDTDQQYRKLGEMNLAFYYALSKEYDHAEKWYKTALTPNDLRALSSMVNDLKDASKIFPNRHDLKYFIGSIYFISGDSARAEVALNKYLALSPNGKLANKAQDILTRIQLGSPQMPLKSINTNLPNDGMVEIPAGFFIMGSNDHGEDEKPEHKVFLDSYYIDKYEVSAKQYAEFLNQTQDTKGIGINNKFSTVVATKGKYHTREGFENYPVNLVNWHGAKAYCKWKGKRLPLEAEWEKAARGAEGQVFPWGNQPPSHQVAIYNRTWSDKTRHKVMAPVNSIPEGKSPYGLHHMSGNVKEWVDDWFDREYYMENHEINPKGQIGGEFKVLRGGSWRDLSIFLYSSFRNNSTPSTFMDDYGFRCAKSGPGGNNPKKLIKMDFNSNYIFPALNTTHLRDVIN